MIRRFVELALALMLMGSLVACSTDTNLGGVKIPNARPDTRIAGQPPTLLEAGFAVEFHWTGSDPDGKIKGYEWKISDNGVDGISPRDTLTIDPLTGAVLHPWRFTTTNDSTFFVLADQVNFPGDPVADPRSFRSHSLFIRAIDDKGAKDPSPAYISFTSTTLVPTCSVVFKGLNAGLKTSMVAPLTVNVGWEGIDPDSDLRVPTKVRFLWKPTTIESRYAYDHGDASVRPSFDDPGWSPWLPYKPLPSDRKIAFPKQTDGLHYFFAIQVQDTAGAVSVDLGYQQQVGNFVINGLFWKPEVTLTEPLNASDEIAAGQPINFSWKADASAYEGKIVSYRHGWDLADVEDPADPGWAVPPGLSPQNLKDTERVFQEGFHTFFLRVIDDSNTIVTVTRKISVIPYIAAAFQRELLVLDQTVDDHVNNWRDQGGHPRNGQDYRNAYWRFLDDIQGGVSGIEWNKDWKNHTDDISYSDVVNYKAVLCYARFSDAQRMFLQFRPTRGPTDKFVWLAPYQRRGGNLFLVGERSMESFLEGKGNYALPIIFNTKETTMMVGATELTTGFLPRKLPDGTLVARGPLMYPYATAGISVLDWTSPDGKYIYGRQVTVPADRNVVCDGLKGLALDPDFKARQGIGPGVIPDTMWTNNVIDWQDPRDLANGKLQLSTLGFVWNADEFVNSNISGIRTTPFQEQQCDWQDAPGGNCIEPMFRGIARFDWMREIKWRQGDTDWPSSVYLDRELDSVCGNLALTDYQGHARSSARTNGQVFGYFSYKMVGDKPVNRADVFWGFDPYRFDPEGSKKAIRWVLSYFGLPINQ